jgi:hypothetical protein
MAFDDGIEPHRPTLQMHLTHQAVLRQRVQAVLHHSPRRASTVHGAENLVRRRLYKTPRQGSRDRSPHTARESSATVAADCRYHPRL